MTFALQGQALLGGNGGSLCLAEAEDSPGGEMQALPRRDASSLYIQALGGRSAFGSSLTSARASPVVADARSSFPSRDDLLLSKSLPSPKIKNAVRLTKVVLLFGHGLRGKCNRVFTKA